MAEILIVDDDFVFTEALTSTLEDEGFSVHAVGTLLEARELLKNRIFSVAFIDVYLPDGNGLALLSGLALLPEPPEAIVVTALGDPDGAASAITHGAWDYIQKPADMGDILLMVRRALATRERKQARLRQFGVAGIVGESLPMRLCLLQMFEAAQTDTPVLISGETGTGKELVARAVHRNSRRAQGPFVVVDCGAISPTLIESELFGNIRGAFTGAAQSRQGLVQQADGGTLFLDEVGELSLEQQKVFLRVLQERAFRPLGAAEEISSNFRVVAATNRNLDDMAEQGAFRTDFLFRLRGCGISLPPLRDRGEDVELLADYGLTGTLVRGNMEGKRFSREAVQALKSYAWPGNVRELLHTVEHAALAATDDPLILLQHLPLPLRTSAARVRLLGGAREGISAPIGAGAGAVEAPAKPPTWREFQEQVLVEHKRRYLLEVLNWTEGNIPRAAEVTGVSRQRLYRLLREHGITRRWDDEG